MDLGNAQIVHFLMGSLYIFAGVATFLLNSKNLLWLLKNGSKWMSFHSKLIHMNLALASIGIILGLPFSVISCFEGKWAFSKQYCEWKAFEAMTSGLVFLISIYLICFDRYLDIKYESWYSKNGMKLIIQSLIFTWISSAMISSLPYYGFDLEPQGTSCLVDLKSHTEDQILYIISLTVFNFVAPIIISLYFLIKAHFGKNNFASMQMNKLVFMLFIIATLGWVPLVYIYITYTLKPDVKFPLWFEYMGPICVKFTTILIPLVYSFILTDEHAKRIKPQVKYNKSGRAKLVVRQ